MDIPPVFPGPHVTEELRERSEGRGGEAPALREEQADTGPGPFAASWAYPPSPPSQGDAALPLLLTGVVFGLQMHVAKLMDIANVHLFFVNLRFVKVLQERRKHT